MSNNPFHNTAFSGILAAAQLDKYKATKVRTLSSGKSRFFIGRDNVTKEEFLSFIETNNLKEVNDDFVKTSTHTIRRYL